MSRNSGSMLLAMLPALVALLLLPLALLAALLLLPRWLALPLLMPPLLLSLSTPNCTSWLMLCRVTKWSVSLRKYTICNICEVRRGSPDCST
jgi:hypothetical protein